MKQTIEQLERKYTAALKKQAESLAAIEELRTQLEQLKADEAAAADAGDIEKYKAIKNKRIDVEDTIFVKEKVIEKNKVNPLEMTEVTQAWESYVAGYNKELSQRINELCNIRKALRKQYDSIVELQNNALEVRDRCAEYLGGEISANTFPMNYAPADNVPHLSYRFVHYVTGTAQASLLNWTSADAVYMVTSKEWTLDDYDRAAKILNKHEACKKGRD